MLYSCCTNVTLCYHPVLMEIILVVIMVMFQSLLVYIYPCCPTYYSSYIYIIICDQVTVVTRQSKVATGLAEKNSLTANTNSSHCHDIYIYIYTLWWFFLQYIQNHIEITLFINRCFTSLENRSAQENVFNIMKISDFLRPNIMQNMKTNKV